MEVSRVADPLSEDSWGLAQRLENLIGESMPQSILSDIMPPRPIL